jgi:hypothetical protein
MFKRNYAKRMLLGRTAGSCLMRSLVPSGRLVLRSISHQRRRQAHSECEHKSFGKRALQGFQLGQDKLALLNRVEERQKLGSLDPDSALAILSLMHSLARTKRIAILCTLHQLQFAEKFADARDTAIPLDFASPQRRPYD